MPTTRQVLIAGLVLLLVVLAAWGLTWLLPRIWTTLVILLLSAILATGLAPIVRLFEGTRGLRSRIPVPVAILVIYLAFFAVAGLLLAAVVTAVVAEASRFAVTIPAYVRDLQRLAIEVDERFPAIRRVLGTTSIEAFVARLPQQFAGLITQISVAAGWAARLLDSIFSLTMVLVFTYYMLVGGPDMKRGFLAWWPSLMRPQVERVLGGIGVKFGAWLRSQALLLLITFALTSAGLWAIGIPYAILLGALSALLQLIPIVGPIAGAVPTVLVAMFMGTWRLILVIVFHVLLFQVQANVIMPRLTTRVVGLSAVATLAAVLIGAQLVGVVGAFLAIPVAAALQVIAGEILEVVRAARGESVGDLYD